MSPPRDAPGPAHGAGDARPDAPYDRRRLSYAGTFTHPGRAAAIRTVEWLTGKPRLLRRIRQFEREGVATGPAFFTHALRVMGIRIDTPPEQVARIPRAGPLVVVANHPHGLVDGMVLAELLGRVRPDFKILTRSLLTNIPEIADHMIPVPFPHEPGARARNLAMRGEAMRHLGADGVVALFPAGGVAAAASAFGPAVEGDWNPFTAKMIRLSGATVLPVHFAGANSRAYQIANRLSATLRQGLLLHEVVHSLDRPQAPTIRAPIPPAAWRAHADQPSAFMAWLRARTLGDA
ncbi:lysophospholipid acyltransferase family protein [Jannaschia sp. GRR-S6-38]|uniref:Lysophospholipid acyltransferase family protein n=1 Tax=Jannaschia ovalis TaxID=3038773 RepID=A0ABY8LJU8_9RHOB|nr:lysophospholipid acyltransferase family protein [Jannaschia sp. GRR-S6-38]WGH80435.1 lysophospholipid acyltransferase family protein [Jannaschia sp. GRR-S6-38]